MPKKGAGEQTEEKQSVVDDPPLLVLGINWTSL